MKAGMRPGNPAGDVDPQAVYAHIDPNNPQRRILTWTPERTADVVYHCCVDGADRERLEASATPEWKNVPLDARGEILILESSDQNITEDLGKYCADADDTPELSWSEATGDPHHYILYRKPDGGAYAAIATTLAGQTSYTLRDAPLAAGTYYYKVVAYDAVGNAQDSNEPSVVMSPFPHPPTSLAASMDGATLTLSWTAPPCTGPTRQGARRVGPVQGGAGQPGGVVTDAWDRSDAHVQASSVRRRSYADHLPAVCGLGWP